MDSKEALETLFEILCEREHTNSEHNFLLKLFNDVVKDLEVLELLKALFKGNVKLGNKVCTGKIYYDECFVMFTSKEAYNKIKEWLDNDK